MLFRQLFDNESSTYTYLLAKDNEKEAVLIDPVKKNTSQYIQLIKQLELTLVAVMETHLHADHITAMGDLCKHFDCESVMGEKSGAKGVSILIQGDTLLEFGGLTFKALYTPGHTNDSYCYLMEDRVFTGDTLLIRGTGRTDFQGGSAAQQYDSLFQKLLSLPKSTLVYPAHDYNGMTVSTIGEEIEFNPRLQVTSKEDYIALMDNLKLPSPKMMEIAIPANKNRGIEP